MAIIESRKQEAVNGMSACIARMVSEKELLISSSSGSRSFKLMEVMDGGGFATLVKGQLDVDVPRMSKVSAHQQEATACCSAHGCCCMF